MTTVAILQARMNSKRLPGKILKQLGNQTVLEHCLERAAAIPGVDAICLATTTNVADDATAEAASRQSGVTVFRGSEADVLSRYVGAARKLEAEVILRATCDCPLLDPEVCAGVLRIRSTRDADYAANNFVNEWPHGLDCEVFTRAALEEANRLASDASDREHVGPYMRRKELHDPPHLSGPGGLASTQRWTLDYPEDLAFLRALWPHLPNAKPAGWRQVMQIIEWHPELTAINQHRTNGMARPRATK